MPSFLLTDLLRFRKKRGELIYGRCDEHHSTKRADASPGFFSKGAQRTKGSAPGVIIRRGESSEEEAIGKEECSTI